MNGTTTVQLAEKTAKAVTGSVEEWTDFLQSAARLYKYSYPEQPLIYAQRPDATACASYEIWNQTMRRYVRRGAQRRMARRKGHTASEKRLSGREARLGKSR